MTETDGEKRPKREKREKKEKKQKLEAGRVGRVRKAGAFGAGAGTRLAFAELRTMGRSTDKKIEVFTEAHRKTAEQMKLVLGQMKGAATKLGQMASFIDTGMVPPEFAGLYQEILAELRDSTPPMSFEQVAHVFEEDHGGPPEAVFAEFDTVPCAAASIGQVHRARLFDGTRVVVKVQYPGIDKAIRSDMKNAKAFMWMLPVFAPGLDAASLIAETERALYEELDYAAEAAHHQRFADVYRGHPFIVVPEPVMELCSRRTLVVEEANGATFDDMCDAPQEVRDRVGEIIFRFSYGTLYRRGFFNADTHPGNYAFQDGGERVVFYDFGATKVVGDKDWREFVALAALLMEGDPDALFEQCVKTGFVRRPDKVDRVRLLEWLRLGAGRVIGFDEEVQLTSELVAELVASTTDPRNDWYSLTRWMNLNPEALLIGRMQIGILAVLAKLRATNNWYRIGREWVYDDAPSTELGKLDAEFFTSRV